MRIAVASLAAVLGVLAAPGAARADDALGVGLYAPSAPFAGTSARLDYVTKLAEHLGSATGQTGTGKTYGRASDFVAAIKAGDLDVAVVDAPYLAALGVPYTVLAVSTRAGADHASWQLVTRGGEDAILSLKGKKVVCSAVGGREADFVYEALLGGELARGFFGAVDSAPDVVSALAALNLGRADAAVVPTGVDLPGGVTVVATLPTVSWPALVALPGATDALKKKLTAAATGFSGGDALGGFVTGGADDLRALAHRFGHRERRGPMVVPAVRVTVDELVADRALSIAQVDLGALLVAPPPLPPPTVE